MKKKISLNLTLAALICMQHGNVNATKKDQSHIETDEMRLQGSGVRPFPATQRQMDSQGEHRGLNKETANMMGFFEKIKKNFQQLEETDIIDPSNDKKAADTMDDFLKKIKSSKISKKAKIEEILNFYKNFSQLLSNIFETSNALVVGQSPNQSPSYLIDNSLIGEKKLKDLRKETETMLKKSKKTISKLENNEKTLEEAWINKEYEEVIDIQVKIVEGIKKMIDETQNMSDTEKKKAKERMFSKEKLIKESLNARIAREMGNLKNNIDEIKKAIKDDKNTNALIEPFYNNQWIQRVNDIQQEQQDQRMSAVKRENNTLRDHMVKQGLQEKLGELNIKHTMGKVEGMKKKQKEERNILKDNKNYNIGEMLQTLVEEQEIIKFYKGIDANKFIDEQNPTGAIQLLMEDNGTVQQEVKLSKGMTQTAIESIASIQIENHEKTFKIICEKLKEILSTEDITKTFNRDMDSLIRTLKGCWGFEKRIQGANQELKKLIEERTNDIGEYNENGIREILWEIFDKDEGIFQEKTKKMILKIVEQFESSTSDSKSEILKSAIVAVEGKDITKLEQLSGITRGRETEEKKDNVVQTNNNNADYKNIQFNEFTKKVTKENVIDLFAELTGMGLDENKIRHLEDVTVIAIELKNDEKDYEQNSLKDLLIIRSNKNIAKNTKDEKKAMLLNVIVGKVKATNEDDLKKNNNELAKLIREQEDILNQLEPKSADLIRSLAQTQQSPQNQAVVTAASTTSTSKAESKKKGGKGNKKRRSRSNAKKRKGSKSKNRKRSKSRKKKA